MWDVLKYNAMMAEKKVTHGRATIFKIVRNVCFTEKGICNNRRNGFNVSFVCFNNL